MFRINKLFFLSLLLTPLSYAATTSHDASHKIVAPSCLIQDTTKPFNIIASKKNLVLLNLNDSEIERLIELKQHQKEICGGFIDVTSSWNNFHPKQLNSDHKAEAFLANFTVPVVAPKAASPYRIQYPTEVNQLLRQMNPTYLWTRLKSLSEYPDRYARSNYGLQVANEIKAEVEAMARNNDRGDVTVYFVRTGNYKQPSVVAKIGTSNEPGIVIGGHMDTLSGNKPGADDDGSGSVTVLEVARTILSSGMHFKKPIYLIWYAAEELGLIGSQYVVSDFIRNDILVSAVMQLDMTGYAYKNDLTMWLIDDYVDPNLTAYLETLINTYVKQPVKHTACGYACSDHASWTRHGFASSMPFESSFSTDNPYIHSSNDTIEKLSLDHMTHYASLAIAFAVELAEPI